MQKSTFIEEINQSQIDVPKAALLFSQEIAYPNLSITPYMERLDHLSELAGEVVMVQASMSERALELANFMFQQLRFQGNPTAYLDPRNSYLNEVLDRRLGIPISLSIVYIAVARRLEIPAFGVGLPGHYIVGVQDLRATILLDLFNGGRQLSMQDCVELVRDTTGYNDAFQPQWLEPASARNTLARMLNNLRSIYIQQKAWEYAIKVIEHLHAVQPENLDHIRDLGVIHDQQGSLSKAVHYYERYLESASHAEDSYLVKISLQSAANRLARRN